jgi:hypothetical protein
VVTWKREDEVLMPRRWPQVWRVQRVNVTSALQVEVVEERLAAGVTSRRRKPQSRSGSASVDVLGRVRRRRVWVRALPRSVRQNSWAPALWGELVPLAPRGSRFVGRIGVPLSVRVVAAFWVVFLVIFLVGGVAGLVVTARRGAMAMDLWLLVLVPLMMMAAFALASWHFGRMGWAHARELVLWLPAAMDVRPDDIHWQ